MMNPDIAVDNLCLRCYEKSCCILTDLIEKIKDNSVAEDGIKKMLVCNSGKEKNLLKLYNVLVDVLHFKDYYGTSTDYRSKVVNSYRNLKSIKNDIAVSFGEYLFELKTSNSFIPMSLTIADAEEQDGYMIVEFHLPFTNYKVLFEIVKSENEDLFKVFVDFYNTIWGKGVLDEQTRGSV